MNKKTYALLCFNKGMNCAQAVLLQHCEDLGMDRETALKLTNGFGGGMKAGSTCGAVAGAIMAIGLKYGQGSAEDTEAKDVAYSMTKEFNRRFLERNNTLQCKELLEIDISTDEGMQEAEDKGLFETRCSKYVADALEILEELFKESF